MTGVKSFDLPNDSRLIRVHFTFIFSSRFIRNLNFTNFSTHTYLIFDIPLTIGVCSRLYKLTANIIKYFIHTSVNGLSRLPVQLPHVTSVYRGKTMMTRLSAECFAKSRLHVVRTVLPTSLICSSVWGYLEFSGKDREHFNKLKQK